MEKGSAPSDSGFYILKMLRIPSFAPLQASRLFSFFARTMEFAATGWLVLELTNSPFLLAVIGMFRMLPALLFGAFTGVIADRADRRKLLTITQAFSAALQLGMGIMIALGLIQFWNIALIVFALGILNAFDWPARMALITDIVGQEMTFSGVAVDNLNGYLMMIAGPTIGGLIIASLGLSWCYAVVGMLYIGGIVSILKTSTVKRAINKTRESTRKGIIAGFKYVKDKPTIIGVLAITVVMNIFGFTYGRLMPVFARDILFVGPEAYGLLTGIAGVGATVAALTIAIMGGVKRVELAFSVTTLSMASIAIIFAMSRWYALSLVLRIFSGVCQAYFEIGQYGLPLAHSSNEMRGRVMAILNLTMQGVMPIGSLEIGAIANSMGASFATLVNGSAALILSAVLILLIPSLRKTK